MYCIYHSRDLDGFASGAIIKKKYPNIKLIGYDYGQPVPYDKIKPGKPVIMIDVSLPMEEMRKLAEYTNHKLTWIDHHISAINEYFAFIGDGEGFCGVFLVNGIAACEIAWEAYFSPKNTTSPLPENKVIKLLGEYDTWRNSDKDRWNNEILPFQFGMRSICHSPETFPYWDIVTTGDTVNYMYAFPNSNKDSEAVLMLPENEFIHRVIERGKGILSYIDKQNERCSKNAFNFKLCQRY